MNLLYLTFGNNSAVHLQAAFSIYSFLNYHALVSSVNIITDQPRYYAHLGSKINLIEATTDELNEWRGSHDFFWRIKIKAIEKVCQLYPGQPVLYLDTDTFLFADAAAMVAQLAGGKALMHENEGPLSGKKSKTEKRMWQQIAGHSFGELVMKSTDCMWNAGLVATPNTSGGAECQLALNICDEMCSSGVTRRLIEQYALSLSLQHVYGLTEAKGSVAHYWSTKEIWNQCLSDFFLQAYFAKWDAAQIISAVYAMNKTELPIYQRIKNTRLKLTNFIATTFPAKDVQYLPAPPSIKP